MLSKLTELIASDKFDFIDGIFNKIGLGSMATSFGLFFSKFPQLDSLQWAAIISLIGGLLFCIEKGLVIYIRLKNIQDIKQSHKDDKTPEDLPKSPPDD